MTEDDWAWIADKGLNAVRIPIGYYHICGADPSVLHGTDFADFGHVYQGAWARITHTIASAQRHGLAVLIDLHAAPGKQNRDAHGGTSGEPHFFDRKNMAHTIHVLSVLVTQLNTFASSADPPLHNIIGVELLNEPMQNSSLEGWYLDAISALRRIDSSIPVYIGDTWMTDQYAGFIEKHASSIPFTVLDHHLYRCYTQQDIATSAEQHVKNLRDPNAATPQMLSRVSQKLQASGGALVVGEWSGALNPGSLRGVGNEHEARHQFIAAQLELYEQYCAGYFFWTYKKQHAGDKGWSLRDAVEAGVFPTRVGSNAREAVTRDDPQRSIRRDQARDKAIGEHTTYWNQHPGHYEHWRFDEGFIQGWEDAWLFFASVASLPPRASVPELGFRGPWAKQRAQEHARRKGASNLWEFEHGFLQGVLAANGDLTSHP